MNFNCKSIQSTDRLLALQTELTKLKKYDVLGLGETWLPGQTCCRLSTVYAPQSGRGEDEYNDFLDQLSSSLARPSTYDIVLGDFNASTGPCENGERFI
uniref:Endonuclease/exonuclease/phosphatase domain-containing protein n=1 Tax=Panagrolaimus sp. ES5 TaxID=591445 RepID=A0AC34G2H7_9BILA